MPQVGVTLTQETIKALDVEAQDINRSRSYVAAKLIERGVATDPAPAEQVVGPKWRVEGNRFFDPATSEQVAELVAALQVVLDHVDYTASACRLNEVVSAVLPRLVIDIARAALAPFAEVE